ncbi:AN1-type zinc finger protein 2B [Geodia barretti]|uniref:AN1-type zinc finger protein 2B n=1 Tax=Geodia barretti TaxID=519541 RepID=A0AA35X2X4_GEOBA|nr:AN1-type zinc finger protein 2B [Geodia barretti]
MNCGNVFSQSTVPVCPLCGQAVSVSRSRGEDVDTQVERHISSGCRHHVLQRPPPRPSSSCTQRGCKRRDLVPYTCPQCERTVCIRHRQPMDHPCHPPVIPVH